MKHRNQVSALIEQSPRFDVVVIGGGASGIGAAVEAALRGYKTLLLEKHDFTKGTSSKSTKLIHGGVRYMAQGDLKMVREALKERGYLIRNAPHLVHDQPFIIPNYRWWEGAFYTIGLTFYDLLAGKFSLGRSIHMGKKTVLKLLPGISPRKLRGGVLYHDGQFDDSRLAMDLLHVLDDHGGLAINYCEVTGLEKAEDRVSGVQITDHISGKVFTIEAKAVINATGVWVDDIMLLDDPAHRKTIRPSQGIHLVLNRAFLPGEHALMIPKTSDGRVLFAVPWHNHLVVGTTDTPIDESSEEPEALEEEVQFILDTASQYLEKKVERTDVLSVFAGLRPLAAPKHDNAKTKEISRNHKIIVSESQLITVIGGKWTTYRKMAQDMINTAIRRKLLPPSESPTKKFPINAQSGHSEQKAFGLYGDHSDEIVTLIEKDPALGESIHPDLPYTWAEIEWCCRNEMVVHLEDLLSRRTRVLLLNARIAEEIATKVGNRVEPILEWSPERTKEEIRSFRQIAEKYIL